MKDVNYLVSNGVNVEKSLELFGDMEMYDATLNDFVEDVEKRIDSLKKFRETGDMQNYAIEVHALKSDARYLGFVTLADLAYQFELKSKANDVMFVYDNYQKLLDEANRCENIARKYLGKELKQDLISDMIGEKTEAILVVDDSNLVANFIKKIFDNKYEVYIANDGARAIELVSGENAPYQTSWPWCHWRK